MKIEITKYMDNHWLEGRAGAYTFRAKVFDKPSQYGITRGRVSKLSIRHESSAHSEMVVIYDRGWDRRPKRKEDSDVFQAILSYLEAMPTGVV
ncbi:hypothetical protein CE91St41_04500 [Oscillospiraceae bacterium]|nr:hypothetical protein CE91St40_04520 [Oscillospiraceae bacterium]BDF73561.1 hypothetical protein CE91St41_04500 [Oscillospiraceae bacterium]